MGIFGAQFGAVVLGNSPFQIGGDAGIKSFVGTFENVKIIHRFKRWDFVYDIFLKAQYL